MARRTKAEAESTRAAILMAAEAEFLARGVGATTLEHIAQRANVTRGAVYWHFKNKSDLFTAMMEQVRMPIERISGKLAEGDAEPVERLRARAHHIFRSLKHDERYRRIYTIWFHRIEATSEFAVTVGASGARNAEVLAAFERVFDAALASKRLRPGVSPAIAAQTVRLLLVGLITDWLRDMTTFDIVDDGGRVFDTVIAGLVSPVAPTTEQ